MALRSGPGRNAPRGARSVLAGRRQRNFDVVTDAPRRKCPLHEIEQHVSGVRVGAARRADRAGIDEVIGIVAKLNVVFRQRRQSCRCGVRKSRPRRCCRRHKSARAKGARSAPPC